MKLLVAAAVAAFALPAFAQDTPAAPPPPPQSETTPMPPMPPAPPPADAAPAPMPPAAPVAAAPAPPPPTPMDGPVPWCSKTVVDHCKEHSAPNGARLSSTPRPPGS